MLMGGIASTWQLYEMATATEAPSQALAVRNMGFSPVLIGLIGSLAMLASEK